jgi:hypothetical protein
VAAPRALPQPEPGDQTVTPDGMGDDLLMIIQVALLPVCWWAAGRIGDWLEVWLERWYRRTAGQADREHRDRPFPFRR